MSRSGARSTEPHRADATITHRDHGCHCRDRRGRPVRVRGELGPLPRGPRRRPHRRRRDLAAHHARPHRGRRPHRPLLPRRRLRIRALLPRRPQPRRHRPLVRLRPPLRGLHHRAAPPLPPRRPRLDRATGLRPRHRLPRRARPVRHRLLLGRAAPHRRHVGRPRQRRPPRRAPRPALHRHLQRPGTCHRRLDAREAHLQQRRPARALGHRPGLLGAHERHRHGGIRLPTGQAPARQAPPARHGPASRRRRLGGRLAVRDRPTGGRVRLLPRRGFVLEQLTTAGGRQGCNQFVFRRP